MSILVYRSFSSSTLLEENVGWGKGRGARVRLGGRGERGDMTISD